MSIQKYAAQFLPTAALVDQNGIPTTSYGRAFLLALFNRTGAGNGIIPIVSPPLTAIGLTIDDALQLSSDWNYVTTAEVGGAVVISSALNLQPGNDIWVFNFSANYLNVYPPSANVSIDALSAGSPYALPSGARSRCFQCLTATQFSSYGN